MTNVIVNAIDVLGQEIDEGVVRISAADAQYDGGSLMLPEYHEQELVAGSTTISGVTPGKVVVTLHWGINRTATFRVFVPDTDEVTLAELALQKYDNDPAVVSQVADAAVRAEGAAARAETTVGSAEAVIEARDDTVEAVATLGAAQTILDARDDTVAAVATLGNAQTVLAARDDAVAAAETSEQIATTLPTQVQPLVAAALADDQTVVDAAAGAVGSAITNSESLWYAGAINSTDDLNTALGKGPKTRVHYSVNTGSALNTPTVYGGILDVMTGESGRNFVQTYYRTGGPGIWKREIVDRTHIVPGQWIFGDWVRSDQDGRFTDYLEQQNSIIPNGADWDTLTEARTWAVPSTGRGYINGPVAGPIGTLHVSDARNSTGNIQSQIFIEYQPSQVWLRFRQTSGNWGAWRALGMDGTDRIQAGSARREAVVEAGLKRRGGVIGTGGKPAIALRFDHHLVSFGEKVLPLLKQHRLPWGQMINSGNVGQGNDAWTWAQLANECHTSGGEVWNHARTHSNVTGAYQADVAVTLGLSELKDNLPSLWVDSWAPPGQTEYMGFVNHDSPEKFFDTYPGKLVLAQHAFVRGSYHGPHHPLSGSNLIGQGHVTIDSQTAAWCQAAVRSARDTGSGLTMMLHSNYLDTDGYMTTSELSQVLAYIAQLRDAGEIVVLSNAGILMADASVPVRQTNMLSGAGAGEITSPWSQNVTSRSYRATLGVPHEAEAWVVGTGEVSLAVDIASPTYPVEQTHTVTLTEGTPQRLSVLVTPPMDTTGITVTLTGSVRHTGIIYRPI